VETEETGVADAISVVTSEVLQEALVADDVTAIDANKLQLLDSLGASETIVATEGDPNESVWKQDDWGFAQWSQFVELVETFVEEQGIDDTTILDANSLTAVEASGITDTTVASVSVNDITWEEDSWNSMQWTAQN
jgi:hypothetical protein